MQRALKFRHHLVEFELPVLEVLLKGRDSLIDGEHSPTLDEVGNLIVENVDVATHRIELLEKRVLRLIPHIPAFSRPLREVFLTDRREQDGHVTGGPRRPAHFEELSATKIRRTNLVLKLEKCLALDDLPILVTELIHPDHGLNPRIVEHGPQDLLGNGLDRLGSSESLDGVFTAVLTSDRIVGAAELADEFEHGGTRVARIEHKPHHEDPHAKHEPDDAGGDQEREMLPDHSNRIDGCRRCRGRVGSTGASGARSWCLNGHGSVDPWTKGPRSGIIGRDG